MRFGYSATTYSSGYSLNLKLVWEIGDRRVGNLNKMFRVSILVKYFYFKSLAYCRITLTVGNEFPCDRIDETILSKSRDSSWWNFNYVWFLLLQRYSIGLAVEYSHLVSSQVWIFQPHHEKTCLCHIRTTKTQSSLRIRAIWSASLLFTA